MIRVNSAQWNKYKQLILDAHESFNNATLTWRRKTAGLNRFGEDPVVTFSNIDLKALIQGNYFRSWPVTTTSETGDLDKESIMALLNLQYLQNLGYTTAAGYFNFNPAEDRFILEGITYKAFGDSAVSYDGSGALQIMIVLKREETSTGDKVYGI